MLPNSLKILWSHLEAGPNAAAVADRRKTLTATSGKVWITVPTTGAAVLYVKFGGASVEINEGALANEFGAANFVKLEVGASVVLDTGGNGYVDVYSPSAWDVVIYEVA